MEQHIGFILDLQSILQ